MSATDTFRCPHDGCAFVVVEPCAPHTESIGDRSESAGKHCWDLHGCVDAHASAWTHDDHRGDGGSEHEIVVIGDWHNDSTAGVSVICKSCDYLTLLDGDDFDDELTVEQINGAAAAHRGEP